MNFKFGVTDNRLNGSFLIFLIQCNNKVEKNSKIIMYESHQLSRKMLLKLFSLDS